MITIILFVLGVLILMEAGHTKNNLLHIETRINELDKRVAELEDQE